MLIKNEVHMVITNYITIYLIAVLIFFAVDIIWLGFVAKRFYRSNLKGIISPDFNWVAVIVFYLIYIAGILIFAVIPSLKNGNLQTALVWGALYGFFTYATYDLTNKATIKEWPLKVVIVDICWGTVLCAIVATLSHLAGVWVSQFISV